MTHAATHDRFTYRAALVLLLVGGVAVLWASQQTWQVLTTSNAFGAVESDDVLGSQLRPLTSVAGAFSLASALALIATRRWGRRIVGIVVMALGVGLVVSVLTLLGTTDLHIFGPLMALMGGVAMLVAGATTVSRSSRWPGMSRRYERTAPLSDWARIDAGEDPTLPPSSRDWMGS